MDYLGNIYMDIDMLNNSWLMLVEQSCLPSPILPYMGGINHQHMGGLVLLYQH